MNFQKAPQIVEDFLKSKGIEYIELFYYAWPASFGSTAGPGGAGGQTMSTFTVEAWVCDDVGPTVFSCGNYYSFDKERFEPFKQVKSWVKLDHKQ